MYHSFKEQQAVILIKFFAKASRESWIVLNSSAMIHSKEASCKLLVETPCKDLQVILPAEPFTCGCRK